MNRGNPRQAQIKLSITTLNTTFLKSIQTHQGRQMTASKEFTALESDFYYRWPQAIQALHYMHGKLLPYQGNKARYIQERWFSTKYCQSAHEIKAFCERFWEFESRFAYSDNAKLAIHELPDQHEWAMYSLIYLVDDEDAVQTALDIFTPLTGHFAKQTFGTFFQYMVVHTMVDYVWELLDTFSRYPEYENSEHERFLWVEFVTDISDDIKCKWFEQANLPPLPNMFLPPTWVYNPFCEPRYRDKDEVRHLLNLRALYAEYEYDVD